MEYHYEEFTSDVEENQILAWTLHKILLTGICTENSLPVIRLAYRTMQGFASSKPFGPKACIMRLYNRLNQDYTGMHALCRFFLENSGPKHEIGNRTMIPFLVNMALLFELFMSEWLCKHIPPEFSIKSQEVISLDKKGTINFKIDLVLYDERNKMPLCVLDTKWLTGDNLRIFRDTSDVASSNDRDFLATQAEIWIFYIPSAPKYKGSDSQPDNDIKQVAFYAMAKECSLALLIYPTPLTAPIDITIRGIRVKSLTFALDGNLEGSGNKFIQDLLALQPGPRG